MINEEYSRGGVLLILFVDVIILYYNHNAIFRVRTEYSDFLFVGNSRHRGHMEGISQDVPDCDCHERG